MSTSSGLWVPASPLTLPRLRLLSFNIQVGVQTGGFADYLRRAWRHALPGADMRDTLDRIADLVRDYDFVAIQEADAGSLRTRFVNQVEYLARRAGFPHHGIAVTRDLRPVAHHCMGFLSRLAPAGTSSHALPARIPGRRALKVQLGADSGGLTLLLAHLSLGSSDRQRQLAHLSGLLPEGPAVLLGDLNCEARDLDGHEALQGRLWLPPEPPATWPSWRPRRGIDHILMSPQVELHRIEALPHAISDHLPVAAEISLRLPA